MQAIQINIDAATPNVSISVASPRAVRVDQSGSAAESAVGAGTARVRCCRGCWLAGSRQLAQANLCMAPRELWSSLSLSTSRLDTEMSTRTPYPPAPQCLACAACVPISGFMQWLEGRGSLQRSGTAGDAGSLDSHGAPWSVPNYKTGHLPTPASCNIIIPAWLTWQINKAARAFAVEGSVFPKNKLFQSFTLDTRPCLFINWTSSGDNWNYPTSTYWRGERSLQA